MRWDPQTEIDLAQEALHESADQDARDVLERYQIHPQLRSVSQILDECLPTFCAHHPQYFQSLSKEDETPLKDHQALPPLYWRYVEEDRWAEPYDVVGLPSQEP